jgi:alpha-amylase
VAILLGLTLGCGDKNPVTPSRPGPSSTGLTITGPDALLAGLSANFALTVTMADGTTRTVVPTWTSSNPEVARVDDSGRVEGRSHGSTTLTASSGGQSASRIVQVVNNYAGSWTGRFVIRACTDTGELTDHDGGFCLAGPGRLGSTGWITLTLVQRGSALSEITGTIGDYSEPIAGTVTADGRLSLSGTVTERDFDDPDFTIATHSLRAWDTKLNGSDGMTGGWSEDFASLVSCLGTAHIEREFLSMTRVR